MKRWVVEFKHDRTSIEDDKEIIKIQDVVLEDRQLTKNDLVEALTHLIRQYESYFSKILN